MVDLSFLQFSVVFVLLWILVCVLLMVHLVPLFNVLIHGVSFYFVCPIPEKLKYY